MANSLQTSCPSSAGVVTVLETVVDAVLVSVDEADSVCVADAEVVTDEVAVFEAVVLSVIDREEEPVEVALLESDEVSVVLGVVSLQFSNPPYRYANMAALMSSVALQLVPTRCPSVVQLTGSIVKIAGNAACRNSKLTAAAPSSHVWTFEVASTSRDPTTRQPNCIEEPPCTSAQVSRT